jgi:hypothetical protein
MKSIRDLAHKMPETRKSLEDYVLNYDTELRDKIEIDPRGKKILEEAVNESFDRYSRYMGGLNQKISAAGHVVGYSADAWLATGDIVGSLEGKAINLIAQVPEKAYSLVYAAQTGNYLDSLQNIFEGIISYLPGFTIVDQGLSRIIQKRMVKSTIKDIKRKLGDEESTTHTRVERDKGRYKGVCDRRKNIISPTYEPSLSNAV